MNRRWTLILLIGVVFPLWSTVSPSGYWFSALAGNRLYGQTEQPPPADKGKSGFWQQLKSVLNKNKPAGNAPESVTEKYSLYYDWIHSEEQKLYDSLSKLGVTDWDKYQNIIRVDIKRTSDSAFQNKLAPNIKVFGWHPYWMGDAYQSYRFDLLSYLAWFSYNIDPYTGKCDNPDVIAQWKNAQELFQLAGSGQCKVLLTITNHTAEGNRVFLQNRQSQETLIDSLISLLDGRGAGVDVNFELVPDGLEAEMTGFLKLLSKRLKAKNPGYIVSVDLPIQDYYNTYQLRQLEPDVDLFLVTGYDYYNDRSPSDGPMAPLDVTSGRNSIKHSVNRYLQAGLKREKLLLGLPYYGAVWMMPSARDSILKFKQHITYRALKARYCTDSPVYDYERWGAYYLHTNEDASIEKCWFDDSLTLSRKMNWILQENLAGMGIWALGYDNGYPELWNLIDTMYGADTMLVYREPYMESRYFNLARSVMEYRSLIAIAGIFIVVFLVAGLFVALFDWRVREVFFQNKTLRLLYALAGAAILLSVYAFYLYVRGKPLFDDNNLLALGVGLVAGVCIAVLVSYIYDKKMKSLP